MSGNDSLHSASECLHTDMGNRHIQQVNEAWEPSFLFLGILCATFRTYSTGQKKVKVPNGRCGGGAVAVRWRCGGGAVLVRSRYA